ENQGYIEREEFPLGGEMGKTYLVTFKFNSIAEAKNYEGGQWADPTSDMAVGLPGVPSGFSEAAVMNNTFYIAGTPTPTPPNSVRMRVLGPAPAKMEIQRYYLNAFPSGGGANGWESDRTFAISYSHTIEVPGHGFVEYMVQDPNCRAINNCGIGV